MTNFILPRRESKPIMSKPVAQHHASHRNYTNYVLLGRDSKLIMSKPLSQHHASHQNSQTKGRSSRWRCHYCGKYVYIKPFCFNAMQEELGQFIRNEVWELVSRPKRMNVIGTKWIYKNKSDEKRTVTRNKARLVAQGYTQIEGVNFNETFSHATRLESIRLLL